MENVEKGYRRLQSDIDSNRRSNFNFCKYILMAVLIMVSFIAGSVFVLIFCPHNNAYFEQLQREELMNLVQLSKSIDWSRLNDSIDNYESQQRSKRATFQGKFGDSIKVTGDEKAFLVETKGVGTRIVDKWVIEEGFTTSGIYNLEDRSYIEVSTDGVYFIYSQLTILMKAKTTVIYEIKKFANDSKSKKPATLAYCSQDKMDKGGKTKHCHTSVTTTLRAGEKVAIVLKKENFTLNFEQGKSFFGLTLLQTVSL